MKKQLILISALAVLFSACSKDDDETIAISKDAKFTIDSNGIPSPANGGLISSEGFDKYLKNNYFAEQTDGCMIEQNGTLSKENFWKDIIGIGPDGYFFADDSAFNYVLYVDHAPSIPYIRSGQVYSNGRAVVLSSADDKMPDLKILEANTVGFTAIRLIGVKGDGTPSYIYSSYRKVSESDFNKLLK